MIRTISQIKSMKKNHFLKDVCIVVYVLLKKIKENQVSYKDITYQFTFISFTGLEISIFFDVHFYSA